MSKKKRILFAAVDVGFRVPYYTQFLNENYGDQVKVESFSKYILPKEHYEMSFTFECPIDKWSPLRVYTYSLLFFFRALFKYDSLHFISGETILTRKLRPFELMTYKLFKKKVIMHFVGSDIRSNDYLNDKNQHIFEYLQGKKIKSPISKDYQLKLIADARKYADEIIVSTPDLLEIVPEAKYLPVFIDFNTISKRKQDVKKTKIQIFHSPSGTMTKGSKYIHEILAEIKNERVDEVEVIMPAHNKKGRELKYSLTRYQMFEQMSKADIVIDQMLIGWYGLKSIEAMYLGANVMCYIENEEFLFKDCPIINTNLSTLKKEINLLIDSLIRDNDRELRLNNNYIWIKEHHTIDSYKKYLSNLWLN